MLSQPKAKIALQSKTGDIGFESAPGERLLYAGLAQGLSLPYECATGTCGTCRGRVMQGGFAVDWPEAPGAARLKADKGDVLLCQTHATGDCTVRVAANVSRVDAGPLPMRRQARVVEARRLTADVMQLDIEIAVPMTFAAGQFVVIEAPGLAGGRAYSMVNHGSNLSRLVFAIKRKPGGGFGNWLFDTDVTGAELSLFGPLGRAIWRPEEKRDILAIAGGSGIAGIMSILQHATAAGHFADHRADVFFGVRTRADAFYVDELSEFVARAGGRVAVTLALSHETVGPGESLGLLQLAHGFVHDVAKATMAGRYGDLTAFLAGPTPMVDGAIRVLLADARLPLDRIRYDKFA